MKRNSDGSIDFNSWSLPDGYNGKEPVTDAEFICYEYYKTWYGAPIRLLKTIGGKDGVYADYVKLGKMCIRDRSSSIDMKSQSSNRSLSWLKSINRVNQNDYKPYLGGWNIRLKKLGVLFAEKDNYGVDQAYILHSISSKGYDMTDDSGKDVFVVLGDANVILKNCLILLNGDWYRYPGSVYTHRRSRMCVSDEVSTSRVSLVNEAVEDFSVKFLKGK